MACIEDRRQTYGRELAQQQHLQERIRAKLGKSAPPPARAEAGGSGEEAALPDDPDTLAAQLAESESQAARCARQTLWPGGCRHPELPLPRHATRLPLPAPIPPSLPALCPCCCCCCCCCLLLPPPQAAGAAGGGGGAAAAVGG